MLPIRTGTRRLALGLKHVGYGVNDEGSCRTRLASANISQPIIYDLAGASAAHTHIEASGRHERYADGERSHGLASFELLFRDLRGLDCRSARSQLGVPLSLQSDAGQGRSLHPPNMLAMVQIHVDC